MNVTPHASRGTIRWRILTTASLALVVGAGIGAAAPKIPKKSELKARVRAWYATSTLAQPARQAAFLEFLPPAERDCFRAAFTEDDIAAEPHVKVLSWKITEIRDESSSVDPAVTMCAPDPYPVEAAARVFITQLDREGDGEPERGELTQLWAMVGGTWYIVEVH